MFTLENVDAAANCLPPTLCASRRARLLCSDSCAPPRNSKVAALACRVVSARGWGDDVTFYPAKLADNQKNAKDQHILKVDAPNVATSYSNGGQYLQIKYGDSKPAFMAVANAPSDAQGGTLELLIKSIPDSTAEMLNGLDAGTEVRCAAPAALRKLSLLMIAHRPSSGSPCCL